MPNFTKEKIRTECCKRSDYVRGESPITEHVPIIKHFTIFLSFPNQIE
jgi:hypothetical protein